MADSAILVTPYSIHDAPLTNYPQLISVLARSSARRAVEQRMRAEGVRLTTTPIRVINEEANAFRTLAEREARDRARKRKQEMKCR